MTGVPSRVRQTARSIQRRVRKGRAARFRTALISLASKKPLCRILLVSDGREYTSEEQFAPLLRYQSAIARRTGVVFTCMSVEEAMAMDIGRMSNWQALGLKLSFRRSAEEVKQISSHLFDAARANGSRVLVFDGDDDLCVLWPDLIAASDAYIKKHVFRDFDGYRRGYVGKTNLTDYVNRTDGFSFADDIIPKTRALPEPSIKKIVLGWNISQDDKLAELAVDLRNTQRPERDIDILCRASVGPDIWTYGMRNGAVGAIEALKDRYSVHAPTSRVTQAEYNNEMLRSRISVSPFGFGEICWRDFESMFCGALLVKPDMSHVETAPDLFEAFETYVPVKWDFSDLGEVCAKFLSDQKEQSRIVKQAQDRLQASLTEAWFLDRFEVVMRAAGVL